MSQMSSRINTCTSGITLASWNVRGMGHPIKRGRVFSHLKMLKADIIFLQETHISPTQQSTFRARWISQVFQASFSSKARGVAILFKKNIPFHLEKMIADPQGRYIIVSGHINSFPLTLINIYGPNFDCPDFFRKIFGLIPLALSENIIMGGDFNCYLDPYLDRLSTKTPPTLATVQTLNNLLKAGNMVDIWRLCHPTGRDYSYYSHVHKSYTRIDYFLVSSELVSKVCNVKYHNILISDHSPITCELQNIVSKPAYAWQFNSNLLSDPAFVNYMKVKFAEFAEFNDTADVSDSTLWETLKVVVRGYILAFESSKKKEMNRRLVEIENMLKITEQKYKSSLSISDYNKILQLRYEYNTILRQRVEHLLLKLKRKQFELGDKPEGLLARQLRGIRAKQAIHRIQSRSGDLITDHKEINNRFRDFYTELYSAKFSASESELDSFFKDLALPRLSDSARESLDSPVTQSEILEAIKSFPSGKAAGPDGFGCEFYKFFSSKLCPFLRRMYDESIVNKQFPDSLYHANICLLLKKGKDDTDPASYRPIALLNFDQKIISKIMANRLAKHISEIIHPDQTGFIPGRFSFCNVRLLLNAMRVAQKSNSTAAVVSLDAQKAFDQVEWPYMLYALRKFGFGDFFIDLVKAIYLHPSSSILTNADRSTPFSLQRGVRQGDPLSPLLFNIALEPLAVGIRKHPDIRGIKMGDLEALVILYADDLLLCISDPVSSIPSLLEYLKLFGQLSGYTINWNKSELMPLSQNFDPNLLASFPFKVAREHLTYLGLQISWDPKTIFRLNFQAALEKLRTDVERWKLLPLSLIGRINAVKMITLPRILYIFQNLPIFLPNSFFQQLDAIVSSFVWAQKTPRISKMHLQKASVDGGLGLPNFKHYYWAANARAISFWQLGSREGLILNSTPLWVKYEAGSVTKTSLPVFLFSKVSPSNTLINNNFIIKNSLKILNQIKRFTNAPLTSVYTPIMCNHFFLPAKMDKAFSVFESKGLRTIEDLYVDGTFISFNQFKDKFNLSHIHFFRYLQLRHYVRQNISHFESKPSDHTLFGFLHTDPTSKQLISHFITVLRSTPDTTKFREAWAREIGSEITEEVWVESLSRVLCCSVNSRYRLIQFKVLHRLHYSRTKLHKIFESISPLCERCKIEEGSLTHMFITCPVLQTFWSRIFDWLSKILEIKLDFDPIIVICGCSALSSTFPYKIQQVVMAAMIVAKKLLLLNWKSPSAPSFKHWLAEMLNFASMEHLCSRRPSAQKYINHIWNPIISYFK
uniref:Reverse transcriptase domain-containing protein n=2 Tax=Pygocentrus nattereri TaxID=42514 RepID=A0AAR2LAI9_PYGNA